MNRQRRIFIAVMVVSAVAAVLVFVSLRDRGRVEVLLPTYRNSNGVVTVMVVLTNSTSRILNVVDATDGSAALVLDWGVDKRWANRLSNSFKIFLNPNSSLTNSLVLTNPPPRFRLRGVLRDLESERRSFYTFRALSILPTTWLKKIDRWTHAKLKPSTEPVSEWIEVRQD